MYTEILLSLNYDVSIFDIGMSATPHTHLNFAKKIAESNF